MLSDHLFFILYLGKFLQRTCKVVSGHARLSHIYVYVVCICCLVFMHRCVSVFYVYVATRILVIATCFTVFIIQ